MCTRSAKSRLDPVPRTSCVNGRAIACCRLCLTAPRGHQAWTEAGLDFWEGLAQSPESCAADELWRGQLFVAVATRPDAGDSDDRQMAQALAEGLTLSEFDAGSYKTRDHDAVAAPQWTIAVGGGDEEAARAREPVARGRLLGECSNLARELSNEPGTLSMAIFKEECSYLFGWEAIDFGHSDFTKKS